MHNKRMNSLGLQVFAAPDNMTGQAQIQVRAREIDFVTSFSKNLQALLDVMKITRMVKKQNGTTLKTKKVSGTLQSGNVAEGDEIPLSQYGFVKANDFTGKTVIPFATSSSSGMGQSGSLLSEMAGTGDWQEGQRFSSGASSSDVQSWVDGLGL